MPSLCHNSPIIVPKISDYGYTPIFRPGQEGVESTILTTSKLQQQPSLSSESGETPADCGTLHPQQIVQQMIQWVRFIQLSQEQANSIHHLPSMEARMAYIHTCLGLPIKAAMLDAATAGRLSGILFVATTNVRKDLS